MDKSEHNKVVAQCADAARLALDTCQDPRCVAARKREGFSNCSGGLMARVVVDAINKTKRAK